MATNRRTLFALSIAFTALLVASPEFPTDTATFRSENGEPTSTTRPPVTVASADHSELDLPGIRAEAGAIQPGKIAGLQAFLDATVPTLMEQRHVVGTAVAVVHDGRIPVLRGYGK